MKKKETLRDLLKDDDQEKIQKVTPIKSSAKHEETTFSFWIKRSKLKELKLKSIETGKSMKALILEGIEKIL